MSHGFISSVPFYCFYVFIFFMSFSRCICVYVCVLNCMSCCHYDVIKHNNKNNTAVRNRLREKAYIHCTHSDSRYDMTSAQRILKPTL